MKKALCILLISLFVIACNKSAVTKYDFISKKSCNKKKSYFSIVVQTKQDTLQKYYYYGLNSNYNIQGRKTSWRVKEYFNFDYQYLYGIIKLKTRAIKGESWRSLYKTNYNDSLIVTVLDIISDTVINGIKIKQCYVYDFKYNPLTVGEDYLDYRIFFDPERRISIKKEYYFKGKLKGFEILEKEDELQ